MDKSSTNLLRFLSVLRELEEVCAPQRLLRPVNRSLLQLVGATLGKAVTTTVCVDPPFASLIRSAQHVKDDCNHTLQVFDVEMLAER